MQSAADSDLIVSDIMTTKLVKLSPTATLRDAHELTRKRGIRHLPLVDDKTGTLLGIVTQKALLKKVISLLTLYGEDELTNHEARTDIKEVAETDFDRVTADERLADVAPFFLDNKHGCLPVVNGDGQLVGMVTSSDFVKLSIRLLAQQQG